MNIKTVILCADDYGLNDAVSQGIIDLLQRQHLSAVSCLVTAPLWPNHAYQLKCFYNQIDIGLHFNLTEGRPLSESYRQTYGENFFSLPRLIFRAFSRQLRVDVLEQECEAQLKCFMETMGFLPDFVDGHQHIHQLPQIRIALLRVYEKYLSDKKAYIRSTFLPSNVTGLKSKIKRIVIYLCGSYGLWRLLKKKAIPHNLSFAGIYSFSQSSPYHQIFPSFLEKISDKGLIMCHPGKPIENRGGENADPIAAARFEEYHYLASEQLMKDCEAFRVRIGKLYHFV